MAAAIVVPAQLSIGDKLVVTGTGFANSTASTFTFQFPSPGNNAIVLKQTSSGGGVLNSATVADVPMPGAGICRVTVSDGTSVVTGECEVFHSC